MPTKIFYGDINLTNEDLKDAYNNHNMELAYYKIKTDDANILKEENNLYGIEIIKKEYNNGLVMQESREILDVTNDEDELNYMLELLRRNKVTPVSLDNIIEDLCKKGSFV